MSLPNPRWPSTRFQPLERPELLRLLALLVISCGVASCNSPPGKEHSPERHLDDVVEKSAFEKAAARGQTDGLYYRLSSFEDSGSTDPRKTERQPEQPSGQASAALLPALAPADFPDSTLLAVLRRRLEDKWNKLGGSEESRSKEESARRRQASVQIIALSFLGESVDEDTDSTRQALDAAASESANETQRLLARAYAAYSGEATETGEGPHLVHSILKEHQDPNEADQAPAAAPFKVDRLSFAESIAGPGKFTPLNKTVAPGSEVLVYGEFHNFHSVEEVDENQDIFYRREFEASLSLFSEAGEQIDGLEFLPRKRGRQLTASRSELMNFWALYRIPTDLRTGRYKIAVDAQDLISSRSASAELWFELPQAAALGH